MKKILSTAIAILVLISTLVFAGCGGGGNYKEVSWDKIQEFINEKAASPYNPEAEKTWKDSYTEIWYLYGEPILTKITYNKDGVNEIFIESVYKEDDEIISSEKQYYVDGCFYEETGAQDEYHDLQITKTMENMDFENALWRTLLDSSVFINDDMTLDYYYYDVLMKNDIKFYMSKTDEIIKIKVVQKYDSKETGTTEYIYNSQYKMIEYYYKSEDLKGNPINETKKYPTTERPTFPELSGYELVSY